MPLNRSPYLTVIQLAACVLVPAPPALRGDSVIETASPVVAEIELEPRNIFLTVHIRERDIPSFRLIQNPEGSREKNPHPCDELCLGRSLFRFRATGAGPASPALIDSQLIEAGNGRPDHRFSVRYRYAWPGSYRELAVEPALSDLKIALLALQEGVPISDRVSLDRPARLRVDWSNAWRTCFQGLDGQRRHLEPKSYLYLEPNEVRHELLQPLMTLPLALIRDASTPHGKDAAQDGIIAAGDRSAVESRVAHYLAQENGLKIEGQPATPVIEKVEFVRQGAKGIEPVPPGLPLYRRSAMLGLVMTYPTVTPVRQLSLEWKTFGSGETVHGFQVIRDEETLDSEVTPQHPELTWSEEDFMERPQATAFPSDSSPAELSHALLAGLLLHTYRAFQIRGEEAAYDHFAESLEAPLLDRVYLDQRGSLIQRSQGLGGDSRVQQVELTMMDTLAANAHEASVDAGWTAHGTVSHWGHSHPRHNQYRAIVHLHRPTDGPWKIKALNFVDGQRLGAS